MSMPVGLFQPKFQLRTIGPIVLLGQSFIWVGAVIDKVFILPEAEMCFPLVVKGQALFLTLVGGGLA